MKPTCRSCNAIIRWVTLASSGKAHPCEDELETVWLADEVPVGKAGERVSLITPEGEMVNGWRGSNITPGTREIQGYRSHFATCPQAKDWRKRR